MCNLFGEYILKTIYNRKNHNGYIIQVYIIYSNTSTMINCDTIIYVFRIIYWNNWKQLNTYFKYDKIWVYWTTNRYVSCQMIIKV